MKKQLKKPFLMMAVTALVLVGTLKVGGAMAYFTTYSTASGSVQMNMGFTQTIPHEEVDSKGKHVSVENTGDYDCFVRVRAFAPSDITLSYQPEDSGWTDGGDGFWYYDQILPAGETTATKLNVSYTFPATDSEDAPAVLLLGSTVGSTRAALTYYSENYSAQMNLKHIGVSLVENGQVVSSRDYVSGNEWSGNTEGKLLANMLGENEKFTPGKQYDEAISVTNSGDIDTFVRVIITKSWKDKEGRKNAELSPDLIELNVPENSGWVVAEDQSTPERMVLYYTKALAPGETTPGLSDTIRIDESVAQQVNKVTDGSTITYQYKYDGYSFNLDAEVDAVQTHNAKAAIKSAWGVDVSVSDDESSIGF